MFKNQVEIGERSSVYMLYCRYTCIYEWSLK